MPTSRSGTPPTHLEDGPRTGCNPYIPSPNSNTNTHANVNTNTATATNSSAPADNTVIPRPRKFILTKYTIYFTTQRLYIVGSNTIETVFRILEIDITTPGSLTAMEDNVYFTRGEIMEVLNGIEDSSEGGLTKKLTAVGLLGFIKFTKNYYLLVVTKRKTVAVLGAHELYHIDQTELIPITNNLKEPEKNSTEARYVQTFLNINLNTTFYYSYSYDLTNSLQTNMMRNKRQALGLNTRMEGFEFNERFMWNVALLEPIFESFDKVYDWFQPIIHGFIDQVNNSVFQTHFYITIIARRSHRFAGARFFKRGVNDNGDVANEVETEQIVSDMLTSSFHDPAAGFYNNPRYTSFVQHRGSIPLSWSQESSPNLRMTKPPIELSVVDPFYGKAAMHFNDLFKRYGQPVQILNLIKQREKTPREMKLLDAFNKCVEYLNMFLPENKKLDYTAWDMSRAAKSRSQDVIKWLETYSEETLTKTGFFHNGKTIYDTQMQNGICRTNCVDCLDRTNTAQFVIGKRALGHQLHALGIIKEKYLEYDSDVTNVLTEMYHDHGDTIALQYGGSHLVNTLQTYRKINQWSSHSRDMIESVKRFYSNSFVDAQRQEAINLFLGNYVYSPHQPMLWELNTDYYLHNTRMNSVVELNGSVSYTHWYNDGYLRNRKEEFTKAWELAIGDPLLVRLQEKGLYVAKVESYPGGFENYWGIKYGCRDFESMSSLFEFGMNSIRQYSTNFEPKGYITQKHTNEKKNVFGLLWLFKKDSTGENDGSKEGDEKSNAIVLDDNRTSTTRFNSFSERLRGTSPKLPMDPEYEEGNYFSPFKSRKPHRELKLLYSKNGDGDVFFDDESDTIRPSVRDGMRTILQIDVDQLDSSEIERYTSQYKAFLLTLLQLGRSRELERMHDEQLEVNDVQAGLPVVKNDLAYEDLLDVAESITDNDHDDEEQTDTMSSLCELESKATSFFSLDEIAHEHQTILPSLKPDPVYESDIFANQHVPVMGMAEYINATPRMEVQTLAQEYEKLSNPFHEYDSVVDHGYLGKRAISEKVDAVTPWYIDNSRSVKHTVPVGFDDSGYGYYPDSDHRFSSRFPEST
mgnify:CR=1 FL=1